MAYIGRQQDGFGVRSRFIYTATGGQTTFTTDDSSNALSYSDGAYVDVYLNGVLLDPSDYTATSLTSIVLDSGAAASDVLEVIVYDVFSVFSGTFTNGITASEATVTGDLIISDKIVHSGDINTSIRFPGTDRVTIETAGSERMRVNSTGVGIGTTVPQGALTIQKDQAGSSTSGTGTTLTFNGNAGSGNPWEIYRDNGVTGDLVIAQDASGTRSEAMRITLADGNLLVGKTSQTIDTVGAELLGSIGKIHATRDGGASGGFNRKTSDGNIVEFYKDGTTVGVIGVNSTDNLFISGNSSHSGVTFGTASIVPFKNNAVVADALDLGSSAGRFRDIYLGGGIQFDSRNNKLDDYEIGTWTPGIVGMTFSTAAGIYTKIGRRVHCSGIISTCSSGTASAVAAKLNGLPFTVSDTLSGTALEDGGFFHYWANLGVSASSVMISPDDSSTEAYMYYVPGSGATTLTTAQRTAFDASNFSCRICFTYIST